MGISSVCLSVRDWGHSKPSIRAFALHWSRWSGRQPSAKLNSKQRIAKIFLTQQKRPCVLGWHETTTPCYRGNRSVTSPGWSASSLEVVLVVGPGSVGEECNKEQQKVRAPTCPTKVLCTSRTHSWAGGELLTLTAGGNLPGIRWVGVELPGIRYKWNLETWRYVYMCLILCILLCFWSWSWA